MNRIQLLQTGIFESREPDIFRLIQGPLKEPAPLLEVLDLYLVAPMFRSEDIIFSTDLLSNQAPCLRSLRIEIDNGYAVLNDLLKAPALQNPSTLHLVGF